MNCFMIYLWDFQVLPLVAPSGSIVLSDGYSSGIFLFSKSLDDKKKSIRENTYSLAKHFSSGSFQYFIISDSRNKVDQRKMLPLMLLLLIHGCEVEHPGLSIATNDQKVVLSSFIKQWIIPSVLWYLPILLPPFKTTNFLLRCCEWYHREQNRE